METKFSFTGNLVFPKEDSVRPFVKSGSYTDSKTKKEIESLSLNVGIKEGDANMAFITAFGSKTEQDIFTFNKDNEKITVAWKDRLDEDVVKNIASYRLYTVDLADPYQKQDLRAALRSGDYSAVEERYGVSNKEAAEELLDALQSERKQFITSYDFIKYLQENLPNYKGKVTATGRMKKRFYNDRYSNDFEVSAVYATVDETKSKLVVNMDLFYNKDCIDMSDFESKKRIYVNGYVNQYVNSTEKNKYMPHQCVLDASKYDMNNDRHKSLFDYKKSYVAIDNTDFVHMNWEIRFINGADTVEFTEDMLTPAQKQQVELGIKALRDFKPRGNIYGERITEYRLADPKLIGEFENGLVDTELTEEEFLAQVFVPNKTVNLEVEVRKAEEKTSASLDDIDDDDLF